MKRTRIVAVVLAAVVAAALAYKVFAPGAPVTAGRGPLRNVNALNVTHVMVAPATLDYDGKQVLAGAGFAYVILDCKILAPASQVRFDDFQLVRDRAAKLGDEQNVGDNGDRDYFYWSFLDESGQPALQAPTQTGPFTARLAFKVPAAARTGYLFYWGLYWGPFDLTKPDAHARRSDPRVLRGLPTT